MANHDNHQTHSHKGNWLSTQFARMAQSVAAWTGHPASFLLACAVVLVWIVTGPMFDYSDTWQLVINTGTTIVTFLMVFLIQNTQNRDILTVQLKLSELVLAMKGAEDRFAAIEDLSDEELQELHDECKRRAEHTLSHIERRRAVDDIKDDLADEAADEAVKKATRVAAPKARTAAARARSSRRKSAVAANS
jgi:low affinity Fe/Cu permease